MFLSWFLGRIQQMCERNYVRFVNDFRLMLVCFGLFWIVSTKHIVANLTYLLQALAIVCFVKRYCRMSDWSCSYNTWIAAKRKVDVLLIMCYRAQISSLRASKSGHQILSAQISSLRASKSGHQTPRASIN